MEVIVTCEFRFYQTPDGKVWTTSAFSRPFWDRYLAVFDIVTVIARVKHIQDLDPQWKRVDGNNVNVVCLPHYIGFAGLLRNAPAILRILKTTIRPNLAVIYRVPSQTAMLSTWFRRNKNNQYSLEVVGDPADVFASGIVNSWLDHLLGWLSKTTLKKMVKNANAVSYVTQQYLQNRYPAKPGTYTVGCSSIELDSRHIRSTPKIYTMPAKKLLFIGSFGQLYKGADLLIYALAKLNNSGRDYHLTLLGDGHFKNEMQELAISLKCNESVRFVGEVTANQVQDYIEQAEVFVMPSRTEGLPRALIEAMAQGLPALGSTVGGIPELLDAEYLFESENIDMLAKKLDVLCQSIESLNTQSARNIEVAKGYEASVLVGRRTSFYQQIKQNMQC